MHRIARSQSRPRAGAALEPRHLEHRSRRLEAAIRALRAQRRDAPSAGLQAALSDFERELAAVRRRLSPRGGP
jgi:hypothetical protein